MLCATPIMAGGAGGGSDSQTVGVGYYADKIGESYGYASGSFGSISDGTSNLYSGAAITGIYSFTDFANTYIVLTITGTLANSGWSTMTIDGTPYARAAASFSPSGTTQWTWTISGGSMHPWTAGAVVFS